MIATWVIWLFAIYGVSAILVHLFIRWNQYSKEGERELRVHLLVYNSEQCLEGSIRSLVNLSRLKGLPLHLVVYDFGSTDNTGKILDTLQKEHPFLFDHIEIVNRSPYQLLSIEDSPTQPLLTIDLREGLGGTIQTT